VKCGASGKGDSETARKEQEGELTNNRQSVIEKSVIKYTVNIYKVHVRMHQCSGEQSATVARSAPKTRLKRDKSDSNVNKESSMRKRGSLYDE